MPRLAATSLDFVLRLLLYWGAAHVYRKVCAQERIEDRHLQTSMPSGRSLVGAEPHFE
jgi:hypothetical protein